MTFIRVSSRGLLLLIQALLVAACGGSAGNAGSAASDPAPQSNGAATNVTVLPLPSGAGTVVLQSDGLAYFVPRGDAAAPVSGRLPTHSASKRIAEILAVAGGVLTRFADGDTNFSPDGMNLGGGGRTQRAYDGVQSIRVLFALNGGVLSQFTQGAAYFSPDGLNLGGGGATRLAYNGGQSIVQVVGVAGGVVTRFADGSTTFSPDGSDLGGGGATVDAYTGAQTITELRAVEGGVQAWFNDGGVYFSPDGLNLGGGGNTLAVAAATGSKLVEVAAFGPRDSSAGVAFQNQWWLAGGFYRSSPDTTYFDLWRSADAGQTWSLAFGTTTPQAEPRSDAFESSSPLVAFRGELWAIGASVWASSDGANWSVRSSAGPAVAREDAQAFAIGDRLVYVDPQYATVYVSSDGIDWSQQFEIPGMARRCGALIAALPSGRIVIAGGGDCAYGGFYTDVWISDDVLTWRQATTMASAQPLVLPWTGRMWPCAVTSPSGMLWMVGGFRTDGGVGRNLSDAWYSRDGVNWRTVAVRDASTEPRHGATCFFDAQASALHVVAGKGGESELNDYAQVLNDVNVLTLPPDGQLP